MITNIRPRSGEWSADDRLRISERAVVATNETACEAASASRELPQSKTYILPTSSIRSFHPQCRCKSYTAEGAALNWL